MLESIDNAIASVDNASQSTITTAYGKVAGADSALDCWAWKGIPFAKPPVGNLRWKAPQDPEPWSKVRQYDQSYSRCTQSPLSMEWIPLNIITGSEDCLYLDIYAPKNPSGKLPVYFWIHGGGNFVGGADELTWCSILARVSNVIVVVIQYRLGPFGFFTHPALNPKGTPEDKSGNYGVLDQIKALKWVQRNIPYFGGDPGNVMITGESAGGFNALNLMISPLAKGLFHKALVQSAGGKNIPVPSGVVKANAVMDKLLVADGTCKNLTRAADLRASMPPSKIEAYLRKKTGEQILQVMMYANGLTEPINPFIDKVVIPGKLAAVFGSGDYNKVPVIIGNNADEMKPFMPQNLGSVPTSTGLTWSNVFNVIGLARDMALIFLSSLDMMSVFGGFPSPKPIGKAVEPLRRLSCLMWRHS
jgi:para-nitrobenzyl esterase